MASEVTLEKAVEELINAIKQSEKYLEYRKQLELINQEPDLKRQVDEFRKRNYEMQTSEDMDFGKLSRFQEEFKGLRENPLVDNFLAAELDFCKMMQNMNFSITEALDFE